MSKKRLKRISRVNYAKKSHERSLSHKEHVRKISYNYEGRAQKIEAYSAEKGAKSSHPIGIRVLSGYLFIVLGFYFFYLFLGVKSPLAIVFGQVIGGLPALFIVMVLIVAVIVLIAGILKRKRWSYYLALAWFSFGIANSLVSLVLLRPEVASFTRSFLILSSVTVFVIDILAILYIASEKNYFFARTFVQKRPALVDRVFVAALIIFLVATISIGSFLGYDFYRSNIEQADSMISELSEKTPDEQIQVCGSKLNQQKDLCLLIISIKLGRQDLCSQIQSDFYRLSCMQA